MKYLRLIFWSIWLLYFGFYSIKLLLHARRFRRASKNFNRAKREFERSKGNLLRMDFYLDQEHAALEEMRRINKEWK